MKFFTILVFILLGCFASFAQSKDEVERAVSYFYFMNCADFGDYTGWLNDVQAKDFENRGFVKIADEHGWYNDEMPPASTKSFDEATIKYNFLENNDKYLDGGYIADYQYTLYIDNIELVNNNEALVKITLRYNDNILTPDSKIDVNRVDTKYIKLIKQSGRWLVNDISISTEPLTFFKEFINSIPQQHKVSQPKYNTSTESESDEKVYTMAMVQQKPEFPGGDAAMYRWLADQISYPAQASEEGVSGRVVVQFNITKNGEITDVKVVRRRHPALDKEAVRLVKSMPVWTPARNNGEIVTCSYTLPVTFNLQD